MSDLVVADIFTEVVDHEQEAPPHGDCISPFFGCLERCDVEYSFTFYLAQIEWKAHDFKESAAFFDMGLTISRPKPDGIQEG